MPNEVFEISMTQLREKFLSGYRNVGSLGLSEKNVGLAARILRTEKTDWTGAGASDFVGYLENGYNVSELPDFDTNCIPVRKRKRARFNDCEGDFRYDLYSSGDENCFVEWTKREAVPGISVKFFLGFRADTPESVIREYTEWLLQAFTTLEANGVDCSISAFNRGTNRYAREAHYGEVAEFRISVKREGERNDFTNWSALFAPGSYRILGFFAIALMGEFNNRTASIGGSNGRGWAVDYNAETKEITINAASSSGHFPREKMTEDLAMAIAATRGE